MSDYAIHPPIGGFSRFSLYRDVRSDIVTVEIPEMNASFDFGLQDLLRWLRSNEVRDYAKVVDYVWNFRRVDYDLGQQRMFIPEDQGNPYRGDVPVVTYSRWRDYKDPFGDPNPIQ